MLHGLEYFKRYYGIYRGQVTENRDPEGKGRIYALVPAVGQQQALEHWIYPAQDGAGSNRGSFWPPEIGDSVWVSFAKGDPSKPLVYWGGWFGGSELPSEFAYTNDRPEKRGFITRGGHRLIFNDEPGNESIELSWHKPSSDPESRRDTPDRSGQTATLSFTENGIRLTTKDTNTSLVMEDGKIVIDAKDVEIATGADQAAMRGDEWFQWALNHNHGTPVGPSTPPVTPPPRSILSRNTKLK